MSEWKEYKLGDVLEIKYGKDHKALPEGEIPAYGSGGIMRYVDRAIYEEESILIPRKGSLNNIFYKNEPFWTVDTMFWSKINKTIAFPKFLFYQLTQIDYSNLNVGSAVPSLTVPVINDIEIKLPSIPDQIQIATALTDFDDKIDLLQRQNKTLEALAETLFRQWFVEEADESWPAGKIEDIIEFNPKRSLKQGTLAPFLEMSELSTTTFAPTSWYYREFSSGTKFVNGDTLLARITPCLENGKTAYVNFLKGEETGWGSTEYIIMRPKDNIHPFLAYVVARYQDFREFAESCMVGSSGRQRIDIDNLRSYEIEIPDEETIEKFNDFCRSIVPKLENNIIQIQTLTKLRDNLLPKLMSGEVRIKN